MSRLPQYADAYLDLVVARTSPRAVVPWLLMSSLGYYHLDVSLVSDGAYEEMWATVRAQPWLLERHRHGCLVPPEAAESGSLFELPVEAYPHPVRGGLRAALDLTSQRPDPARMDEVMRAPFSPPERVWDVYRHGRLTWREHLAAQDEPPAPVVVPAPAPEPPAPHVHHPFMWAHLSSRVPS